MTRRLLRGRVPAFVAENTVHVGAENGALSPPDAHREEEEQGDCEVADYRCDWGEQSDDDEQHVCGKAGSQPVSEESDLIVSGVGPDESSVQCVPPEQGEKSVGDEQGQSVEGNRHPLGPIEGLPCGSFRH